MTRWAPSKTEGELLIDMVTARLEPGKIAARFRIDVQTLANYLTRVQAAATAPYPDPPPLPPPPPPPAAPARVLVDRVFAREPTTGK